MKHINRIATLCDVSVSESIIWNTELSKMKPESGSKEFTYLDALLNQLEEKKTLTKEEKIRLGNEYISNLYNLYYETGFDLSISR